MIRHILKSKSLKTLLTISVFVLYCTNNVWASDDISCEKDVKKDHIVHCKTKKVMDVSLVSINGGECNAPSFHWHGDGKFAVPGTKECGYVGSVTLSIDGHNKTFAPL
jgi:hypothetical protein